MTDKNGYKFTSIIKVEFKRKNKIYIKNINFNTITGKTLSYIRLRDNIIHSECIKIKA